MIAGRLLENQARRESNARTYARSLPLALVRGEGVHLVDADGRTYIDCLAGAGTLALGHNHPVVLGAIRAVLDSGLPLHTLDFATPVKDGFVEELLAHVPGGLDGDIRVHFCSPAGTDAVEAALKLVRIATGRRSILAFSGGYHGMTAGALAASGPVAVRAPLGGTASEVHFLPYPSAYRCPFGVGGAEGARIAVRHVERLLDDPHSGVPPVAGMILEVVQGEGGSNPAPDDWLRAMRRITAERGIPLIVDEVQTGVGRTGRLFAFEHAGIEPDVVVLAKAIGGGLPLAVILYRAGLDVWEPGAHTGTFRGNQLAMAAGAATIREVVRARLDTHAAAAGQHLVEGLRAAAAGSPSIGDVRGRGLMIGVELVDPAGEPDATGALPADGRMARAVQLECLERGLLVERGGRHGAVIRLLPPLIVTAEQVGTVVERLAAAVRAAERARGAR